MPIGFSFCLHILKFHLLCVSTPQLSLLQFPSSSYKCCHLPFIKPGAPSPVQFQAGKISTLPGFKISHPYFPPLFSVINFSYGVNYSIIYPFNTQFLLFHNQLFNIPSLYHTFCTFSKQALTTPISNIQILYNIFSYCISQNKSKCGQKYLCYLFHLSSLPFNLKLLNWTRGMTSECSA